MICDLAEYYHILNYKELPPSLVAVLVIGLPDNSRIKMQLSGQKLTLDQTLLALLVDNFRLYMWAKGGKKRGKKPKSIYEELTKEEEKKEELMSFETIEEYEAFMARKRAKYNG